MPTRSWVLLAGAAACALVPAAQARGATVDVSAGPPVERRPAGVPRDAEVNAFFPGTVTIRQGDRVHFHFRGFHNAVFPAGGQPAPGLITTQRDRPIAGVTDAAGAPFWFNGQPRLILDPRSASRSVGGRSTAGGS